MTQKTVKGIYKADAVVIGAGLAGIVSTIELLQKNKKVILLDRDCETVAGGLARDSFGGVMMIDTPIQKRQKVKDSMEQAWLDWQSYAQFSQEDHWPKLWAKHYIENSINMIYEWLVKKEVSFLPVVNWPERGFKHHGNSVPRWHIAWGTGFHIIRSCLEHLKHHSHKKNLQTFYLHKVSDIIYEGGVVTGCAGFNSANNQLFTVKAEHVVIATGGICGGDLSTVKKYWNPKLGDMPQNILNGSHKFADGLLHHKAQNLGASLTHLDKQWHYAAGILHPKQEDNIKNKGLSLVPPRSALWINALGQRISKEPLVGYTDTSYLVERILQEPGQYSWQIMNWKIAIKELAVSGCQYMPTFMTKNKIKLLWELIFGNKQLVKRLEKEARDFIVASSLEELVYKMHKLTEGEKYQIDEKTLKQEINNFDEKIRNKTFDDDYQLQQLEEFKKYKGDRIRMCKYQTIDDPKARPFIAIREFILTRKSLGGLETDLHCRVLSKKNKKAIDGLYAVGEASGFGGGGIHGSRSLEGTFLGSCILGGNQLARMI